MAEVDERVETGLYGYALVYEGSRSEDTSCSDWGDPELMRVRSDGTWEVELEPGVDYDRLIGLESHLELDRSLEADAEDPGVAFRLAPYQVESAAALILRSCPG